ncbi:outer membrane beta-barrel protein [Lewinella sp. 4G2]|uniref:outer membrane beta-barrel protein n=1 Tax=Lewinella sp. 4G2 TaxID=1803372 RepID=UPI0007B48ABC|nr:outer membrane beta-barrel protein [Lewinella sp. 4G2]OAV42881.1 hypothetical protein A3850_016785 [Lewinella sp. 4G2]
MNIKHYAKSFFLLLALGAGCGLNAQVNGLSYTLQPTINYNIFDDQSALDNGIMYGGRLGLGFGQNVELRALYMRSASQNTNFSNFDFDDFDFMGDELGDRDIDLTRYGGEVKLNLSRGKLLPYLTVGAGIQEFALDGGDFDDLESETIYAAGGLGVTFSFLDRFTLNLEARNTSYNQNAIQNLVLADDRDRINLDPKNFTADRLYNWSFGAGLEFYLGGRRPGTLSAVDQAYSETFGNGFRNVSLLVEPTLGNVNWDDALPYQDTYFGGASLGLDFGPLVGARVFYYRSMEDGDVNFDFDDLSMYGADFRFRFSSVTTGLSPFLTVGGGYIDVQDDYLDRNGEFGQAPSQGFASGGGGISLNITRNFRLTGTYRALLTTGSDIENVNTTDQIRTSNQWTAGINLAFGKKAARPDAVFSSTADARVRAQQNADQARMQAALAKQAQENKDATNQLRADYEMRMDDLRAELAQAEIDQDTALVAELEEELDEAEEVVAELEDRSEEYDETIAQAQANQAALLDEAATIQQNTAPAAAPASNGRISLTPAELEGLIEEIFEGINAGMNMMPAPPMMGGQPMMMPGGEFGMATDTARINQMEREIADLKAAMGEMTELQKEERELNAAAREENKEELRKEMNESTKSILTAIQDMRSEIRQELDNKSNMSDKERKQINKAAADEAAKAAKEAEKAAKEAQRAAEKAAKKAEKEAKKGNN